MTPELNNLVAEDGQIIEPVGYDFGLTRRSFVQVLGAGLLIAASGPTLTFAQDRPRRGAGGFGRNAAPINLDARLHLGKDGSITVLTGKVEGGQGSRAELTQAAAEELGVPPERIQLLMADTLLCPDDGMTVGSRTTPSTVPPVRQACAAARHLLEEFSRTRDVNREITYADLASDENAVKTLSEKVPQDVQVRSVKEWKVMGVPASRPNRQSIVTGSHQYPSDILRPDMLYGNVLRPPSYGAKIKSIDLSAAKPMNGVIVVRDNDFIAVAAPTTHQAKQAVAAIESTARWDTTPQVSSKDLFEHLKKNADIPANPFKDALSSAATTVQATYHVPYVQHCPLEPRATVAEWNDGNLTVWTATQNPFGVRRELGNAFHLDESKIRVIVPDFGAAFGGKHTGECAVEAARIAQSAKRPVSLRWTRVEEFTWAYFRPAAVIEAQATLDARGAITSWYFININSGPNAVETPYRVADENSHCKFVQSSPPLRHGSYRALAATANNFAREVFMDELATAADKDPLEFRLAHLAEGRLKDVLQKAATEFDWSSRRKNLPANTSVGLACGTEKGSYVAACAQIQIDAEKKLIQVQHVTQAFECGAVINPDNLRNQITGAIIMGLGPALREAMEFDNGAIQNASFWKYAPPRFSDVPEISIHLLNRPDLPSAGAGETPLICIAPAIANALAHVTHRPQRQLPLV